MCSDKVERLMNVPFYLANNVARVYMPVHTNGLDKRYLIFPCLFLAFLAFDFSYDDLSVPHTVKSVYVYNEWKIRSLRQRILFNSYNAYHLQVSQMITSNGI